MNGKSKANKIQLGREKYDKALKKYNEQVSTKTLFIITETAKEKDLLAKIRLADKVCEIHDKLFTGEYEIIMRKSAGGVEDFNISPIFDGSVIDIDVQGYLSTLYDAILDEILGT